MSRQSFKKPNGVKLPLALQKELGLQNDGDGTRGRRRHGGNTVADRKERRKATRVDKRRNLPHVRQHQKQEDELSEEFGGDLDVEEQPATKNTTDQAKPRPVKKSTDIPTSKQPKPILKRAQDRSYSPDLSESDVSRASSPGLVLDPNSRSFKQRAEEDDAEIVALERRLGMKGKTDKMGDDLLDFVLDGLEDESEGKKRKREGQDWLDQKRRKVTKGSLEQARLDDDDDDDSELDDAQGFRSEDMTDGEDEDLLESDEDEIELDASVTDITSEEDREHDEFDGFETDGKADDEVELPKRVRENPYVAPVVPGSTVGKYVPPSLRKQLQSDSSGLESLKRQLQGHLNKLSEANIISILGEIEKLYRTNPRQDVTTVLIDLVLTSFSVRSALQNTFIILYAAFLTAVYKVMGTDFGAELLVRLVERFDKEYNNGDSGKESLNLISLLANLFTFNVVSSNIIYDHIRLLLSDFNEANAELLLRVVRDCGPQLRVDDPSALKGIVQMMQDSSAETSKKGQNVNIRTQVMMDTITDLKNNKMKNATNAAGMTGEHITRMRKALGSLNNRALKATEPLRISRNDIANSDKKGKWWLVGASWKGNELKQANDAELSYDTQTRGRQSVQTDEEVDLLALAKQYRMNTDVRRSIFVAIMSATDVRDAQTRLLKLRLSTKQEQEIAKVLLRCARAEPAYNPYYALLAKNLCKDNKKVRMGFQFGLWDFFGRMGEKADDEDDDEDDGSAVEMHEIVSVAKMYAYLIFHGHLPIGVLKTLNIGFLKEQATMFLEVLLISVMTQPKAGEKELMKVFSRAAETSQIVKSLQYFVKKNVRKSDLVSKKERDKVKEGCHVADVAFKMIDSAESG